MRVISRAGLLLTVALLAPAVSSAQSPDELAAPALESAGAADTGPWHLDLALSNVFDGNINHDPVPVRSYGIVPAAGVRYETGGDTDFVWGYEIAANTFTGTDQWDRISHGLYSSVEHRLGTRVRVEASAAATWKGSSEDRELSNEYGASGRTTIRLLERTRLSLGGGYRYKQYPDDPETSGPSPFAVLKVDQRLDGDRRLSVGYKYQTRQSQAVRDRYRRSAYLVSFATPIAPRGGRLEAGAELRFQHYERLIKVGSTRVLRRDRRLALDASYRLPVNHRTDVVWFAGYESRDSNDDDKRYRAPAFGMTMVYHWR